MVAHRELGHAGPERLHHARALVAQHDRHGHALPAAVRGVQAAVADAARRHADQHLAARAAPPARAPPPAGACPARRAPLRAWTPPGNQRAVPDPRIEVAVEQVDGEVDGHEQHRDEQDGGLGERVVALVDRPQHQAADAGQGEDLLDHHRAAEQDADLQPRHRDHRDQRVAERVLEDDQARRRAPWPRRCGCTPSRSTSSMQERVVRAMLAALAVPRQRAGRSMIVRLRRGSVAEVHPHHRRHPAEVEREEQDQHGALPEHRHREPEEGAHPGHVVHRLVAADRRHDAGRDAEHEGEGDGEEGQLEGDRAGAPGSGPPPACRSATRCRGRRARAGRSSARTARTRAGRARRSACSSATMAGLTTASAPIICSTTVPGISRSMRKISTVSPSSVRAIEYRRTRR